MKLTCNIDDRGRRVRAVGGFIHLGLAGGLVVVAWMTRFWWIWLLAGTAAAAGAFMLFEARNKWCVVRAMGIKTRV